MNADMKISERGVRMIASFEGAPRMKARRCEGGRWELGHGWTVWPPRPGETVGRPVKEGDTCTEAEAIAGFDYHLDLSEEVVRKHVKVKLKQHQFDALVSKVYNIGETQFATGPDGPCTILRMINDPMGPRWEDAAEGFTLWTAATKDADERDADEPIEWYLSPDKTPCPYRRRFTGLLRRCLAEGTMFHGFNPFPACDANAGIELLTRREWNPKRKRNEDVIVSKTELTSVLRIARNYPLPDDAVVLQPEPVKPAAPVVKPDPTPAAPPPPPVVVTKPVIAPPLALPKPAQTVDVSKLNLNNIKVENGAKPMETSDRAIAFAVKATGVFVKVQARRGAISATAAETIFDVLGDAFIMSCVVLAGAWLVGRAAEAFGSWKREQHLKTATTLTY